MENRFEILDSVDSAILTNVKIKYSYWLPVVLALKRIPVFVFYPYFDVFGLEANTGFCCLLFRLVYYRYRFGMRDAR